MFTHRIVANLFTTGKHFSRTWRIRCRRYRITVFCSSSGTSALACTGISIPILLALVGTSSDVWPQKKTPNPTAAYYYSYANFLILLLQTMFDHEASKQVTFFV